MDTTSASGSATFESPNGPVWAIDTLNEKWTIAPVSLPDGADYTATLHVTKGSKFAEFADPGLGAGESSDPCPGDTPGGPRTGSGAVTGTIEYDIYSSAAPDLNSVPAAQAPNASLSTVLGQIFDNSTYNIVGGGSYTFSYSKVCGQVYKQAG
ncbi:MAG TPA: hypothetical protein VGM53_05945 [Streptosporangiaceae bacterium]|jgi:hypothetical protein